MTASNLELNGSIRALVTGGAGFIGAALVRTLLSQVASVRVIDNLSSGDRRAVSADAEFILGDILDREVLSRASRNVDVVFHLAALRSVPRSLAEPQATNEANVEGTISVLDAAARAGCSRLIYSSSSSVYGEQDETKNHESMTPRPISPYGVSKLAAEHYCRVWNHLGRISAVSLRYFNVFGPGQSADSEYSAVFPRFIRALLDGAEPVIYGDGKQSRDFTFIDDAVAANIRAATASQADGLAINVAAGRARTVNFVLESIAKIAGVETKPRFEPPRAGDIRFTEADITLAARVLGWAPVMPWDEAVRATISSFADNGPETFSSPST